MQVPTVSCGRRRTVLWLAGVLVAAALFPGAATARAEEAAEPGPTYVGRARCATCHSLETEHWDPTVHGRLFAENPRTPLESRGCEACHGPGSGHVDDPGAREKIVAFTRGSDASVERMNTACLACHSGAGQRTTTSNIA